MPSTYKFRLTAHPAEFYPGGVSVAYGFAKDNSLKREEFTGTLPEALARLEAFSKEAGGPSRSSLVLVPGQPTPRGFKQARTYLDNKGAAS